MKNTIFKIKKKYTRKNYKQRDEAEDCFSELEHKVE